MITTRMQYLLIFTGICFLFACCRTRKINNSALPARNTSVIITGHRGAAGLKAENSLSAIKHALALKTDRIEIDIHQSKDSIIILMHDETISRTTNGDGYIKDMNWGELVQYRLNPFPQCDSSAPEKIPTLDEVLQLVAGKATLLIEIKQGNNYYPGIEERLIALIRKHKAANWCIIHSFKEKVLERMHQLAPEIPLHVLLINGFMSRSTPDYIREVSVYNRLLTKNFIDKMHQSGKKVNAWTVNNREEMAYFMHIGIDGIITDYPDIALELRDSLPKQ